MEPRSSRGRGAAARGVSSKRHGAQVEKRCDGPLGAPVSRVMVTPSPKPQVIPIVFVVDPLLVRREWGRIEKTPP